MSSFSFSDPSLLDLDFTFYAVTNLIILMAFIFVSWRVNRNFVVKIFLILGLVVFNVYQFLPYSAIRMMMLRLSFALSASSNIIKISLRDAIALIS